MFKHVIKKTISPTKTPEITYILKKLIFLKMKLLILLKEFNKKKLVKLNQMYYKP